MRTYKRKRRGTNSIETFTEADKVFAKCSSLRKGSAKCDTAEIM
jgi:hypothetical protein